MTSRSLMMLAAALGLALPAAPAAAKPENGRTFGTWTIQCAVPPGRAEAHCVAAQTQVVNESKARLITVEANVTGKGELTLLALLPLGIGLAPGVTLTWEDGSKLPMVLQRCVPDGCLATVALSTAQQKTLRSTKKITVRAALPGLPNPTDIPVSLDGLDAALDSLN